jgi:methylated-DNA-protein-cysteine methyltransferase-like protein
MGKLNSREAGSDKYRIVWDVVREVPKGRVSTYGEIARLCGLMRQARFVGQALRNTPPDLNLPWHRIINSQGKISFPRNGSAYRKQKKLLEKDGIIFIREKVDLRKYGWPARRNRQIG